MKIKQILENIDKMPSTLKGFNQTPKLTPEQKNKLMDMVGRYNEFGQKLKIENALIETAQALSEISNLAETYACNEAQDWFATEVVKGDFKRARGISDGFQKISRECHGKVQQLNALYEDMGHILARYYEIADPMSEVAPNPMDIKGQRGLPNVVPQTVVSEVVPNDKNIKGQRETPHTNGPAVSQVKEVSHNESNLQSQRELSQGGPESYTPPKPENKSPDVKSVSGGENVKGNRDVPQGGPSSYTPPKPENQNPGKYDSLKKSKEHNEDDLQSQREFPSMTEIINMK